ncbi:MAG: diacylglycerol kinase family protein [Candidatus Obscuribacterales bacterium]|nr:diacylglycerol kinase family protein [Candidatus Obscuribacterales bacterium]
MANSGKSGLGEPAIATELQERVKDRPGTVSSRTTSFVPASWQRKSGRALNMIESFYHAFHGIWVGLKEERNVRIHFLAAIAVAAAAVWLKVDTLGCISLAFSIGLVLITEFLNTSLEHLVNLYAKGEYHESARYAKDTAAAAVLCASLTAVVVGAIVLGPKLLALIPQ